MVIDCHPNYEALSRHAADMMHEQIRENPRSVMALAAGDSPRLAYTLFVQQVLAEGTDYSQCTFVALDEWLGIDHLNPGSCAYFLNHNIVSPLNLASGQYRLFDGTTPNPQAECEAMNRFIALRGGLNLMVVGIGMNGHIGFNEPGTPLQLYAHVAALDTSTMVVGQKYFAGQTVLEAGVTLGLQHFLESDKVLLLANGSLKAGIIQRALEQPPTLSVPASAIQLHAGGRVLVDQEAASQLSPASLSKIP